MKLHSLTLCVEQNVQNSVPNIFPLFTVRSVSLGLKLKTMDLCSLPFDGEVPDLHLLYTSSPKKARVEMAYPRNSKYIQPSMCLYWSLVGPWPSLEDFWLWLTARCTLIGRKALTTCHTSNTQHSANITPTDCSHLNLT